MRYPRALVLLALAPMLGACTFYRTVTFQSDDASFKRDGSRWLAFAKPAKRLAVGDTVRFGDEGKVCFLGQLDASVEARGEGGEVTFAFSFHGPVFDQAIAVWKQQIHAWRRHEFTPNLVSAYLHKASALRILGENDQAIRLCDRVIALWEGLTNRRARRDLRDALAGAYLQKGLALRNLGQPAEAGALFTYGPDVTDALRRSASLADRILRGAKPAETAVEQATRFELIVNNRSAKTLGVAVPETLLKTADRVIE